MNLKYYLEIINEYLYRNVYCYLFMTQGQNKQRQMVHLTGKSLICLF